MNNKDNNKKKTYDFFRVLKDKFLLTPLKYASVFVAGIIFASSLVYAWNAIWHGTDWVRPGAIIESQKIGENMQYLYEQINDLKTEIANLRNTITNLEQTATGTIVAGCVGLDIENPSAGNCWGGASLSSYRVFGSRRYQYSCPNGTKTYVLNGQSVSTAYYSGGDGGMGAYGGERTFVSSTVDAIFCVKQ